MNAAKIETERCTLKNISSAEDKVHSVEYKTQLFMRQHLKAERL